MGMASLGQLHFLYVLEARLRSFNPPYHPGHLLRWYSDGQEGVKNREEEDSYFNTRF